MTHIIWEFRVVPQQRAEFESAYASRGVWAQLFRRDPAYRETLLLKDPEQPGRYVTIDMWEDRDSYLKFKERSAADYRRIDEECETLTTSECQIGIFETVG